MKIMTNNTYKQLMRDAALTKRSFDEAEASSYKVLELIQKLSAAQREINGLQDQVQELERSFTAVGLPTCVRYSRADKLAELSDIISAFFEGNLDYQINDPSLGYTEAEVAKMREDETRRCLKSYTVAKLKELVARYDNIPKRKAELIEFAIQKRIQITNE